MSAVPVPDYRLVLGDRDLTEMIRPRLQSLTLTEKRGEATDQLDIVLDDADGRLAIPLPGVTLQLQLGWAAGDGVAVGLVDKGSFVVSSAGHAGPPDAITLSARSADIAGALRTRREQGWKSTTLGAIVAQIAARHGYRPRCAPALASVAVPVQHQSREGDLAFLRRLGREHDAVATIKHGALILKPIGSGLTASGGIIPGITIARAIGDRHSFSIEEGEQFGGVTANWHDRAGATKRGETIGKADGAKVLSHTYASASSAKRAAQAEHDRLARAPRKLSLALALGRADIYPEQRVRATGYKAQIDAEAWLVAEVRHGLSSGGFTTALELEKAG